MNKKRIFGIVLFIILGLFMLTYANTREEGENTKLDNSNTSDVSDSNDQYLEEEQIDSNENNNLPVNDNNEDEQDNNTVPTVNQNNNTIQDNTENNGNDLSDLKQQAKNTIKEYSNSLDLNDTASSNTVINKVNNSIDDATTEEEIKNIVEEAKKELDELKQQEELEKAKQEAIEELKNYQSEYNYSEENQKAYEELLEEIIENINNSETIDSVNNNLEAGKTSIDTLIEKDLTEYKESKKEEINNYAEETEWNEDYQSLVDNILNDAKDSIDMATTKEEIDEIVAETKEKLDQLKNEQQLDEYKESKKEEIDEYNKDELYSEENKTEIDKIKEQTKELIDSANSTEEIDQIINESKEKIDEIQKLTETSFTITFVDFNGKTVKTEEVLYGNSATAPDMENITNRSIVYRFENWDKDFSNIKSDLTVKANYVVDKIYANVYSLKEGVKQPENGKSAGTNNYVKIGTVELKQTDEIITALNNNKTVTISIDENVIINSVNETLPVLDKLNYKYNYYVLKFEKADGFHIDASQIIDEEQLKKNTVTVTYQLDDSLVGYVMDDNQTTITSTVITGRNEVTSLPKVYKDGIEQAVVWNDGNGIISNITVGNVNLNEIPTVYTSSITLTASLDKTAPTLTLNGDLNNEIELSLTDEYVELGYNAYDNFSGDITDKVEITIKHDGMDTNKVDYSIAGIYEINYSVVDNEGNKTTQTRTITVIDPIKEVKANVFVLNENVERPSNNDRLSAKNYTKIGEVSLVVDKVRSYINGNTMIISNDDIATYVIGGENSLPKLNDKYYYYEYYVIKYEKDGFHIDCEKMFNSELYKSDKLEELNNLLNKDYSDYQSNKTSDSYNNLVNVINDNKNKEFNSIEEIENAINEINNAINNLKDIELLSLVLSGNNDVYDLNQKMNDITVTAIYNDETKNHVLTESEYEMSTYFDAQTVGNKSIIYIYNKKTVVYNYTVKYSDNDLTKKANKVSANLTYELDTNNHGISENYYISFNNLDDLNVKNIEIIKDKKVLKTINLIKLTNNKFSLSKEDYNALRNNNTIISGQIIKITYEINNQQVSVNYYEFNGELIRM